MRISAGGLEAGSRSEPGESLSGIVVAHGRLALAPGKSPRGPRIAAFVWGGKVRRSPTLPFGRWKGAP